MRYSGRTRGFSQGFVWFRNLVCVAILLVVFDANSANVKQIISGDDVETASGKLKVIKIWFDDGSWTNRVLLRRDVLFEDSENEGPISIEATYPIAKPADLVLLGIVEGGSACPMVLRVVEIKKDGKHYLSEEFGNCLPPADPKYFKKIKENPVYQDREWRIALPVPGSNDEELVWYVYRDGRVMKR